MNKDIISHIKEDYYHYSDTYRLIADTIIKHGDLSFEYTIKELAELSYCAQSTIMKFVKHLGYPSYTVFKHELNNTNEDCNNTIITSFSLVDEYIISNEKFVDELVMKIKNADHVYIFASGLSRIAAIDFSMKGNKIESNKFMFEYEPSVQSRMIPTISDQDMIIFISNSGRCKELINFKKNISTQNIVLVTNRDNTKLHKQIPIVYNINNKLESESNFKEFSRESKYSLLYFFDCIFNKYSDITITDNKS